MNISLFPKCVLPNTYKIIGVYVLIYIKYKETIGFESNRLTKINEKIESLAYSSLILNHPINDS